MKIRMHEYDGSSPPLTESDEMGIAKIIIKAERNAVGYVRDGCTRSTN